MALEITREENVTPWDALLMSVRRAAGRVTWVDDQLSTVTKQCDGDMNDPRVITWLKESRLERTMLAKMAKAAIDAGVAERMVRQTEMEGQLVAEAVVRALDVLEFLTLEQRATALNAAHAALLASGGDQTVVIQGTMLHDDKPEGRRETRPADEEDDDDRTEE